ncbi:MAG: hypothetical protein Q4E05_10095 [Pseudoclavibacter sp.]|nr:hypothetical protein [Pseudoclavibacter sp.]
MIRSAFCVLGGVVLGFAAAHLLNATPRGRALLGSVNERLTSFGEAVAEGYEARTEELLHAIDETRPQP